MSSILTTKRTMKSSLFVHHRTNIAYDYWFSYHLVIIYVIVCVGYCAVTAIDVNIDATSHGSDETSKRSDINNNGNGFSQSPVSINARTSSHTKTTPNQPWKHSKSFSSTFQVPSQILTLAGTKKPLARTVLDSVKPKQEDYLQVIRQSLQSMIHLEDVTLLGFLSCMTVPIGKSLYEWLPSLVPQYNNSLEFRRSVYYEIVDHIQQVARLCLIIYCFDILKLVVVGLGYKLPGSEENTAHAFGHIVYTIWIANRVGYFGRKSLRQFVNTHPEAFGRINLIQKWMNVILHAATVLMVLHILKVESGVAINRSFLAVGSVGTLAFGLASQGIATQVINGLLLASSDRIYEGDDVMLGSNGFAGNIVKLGWLETVIRGSDEIMISIPNADLLKERLSNLSRVRHSQVKQVLRLRYDDVDKIPVLIKDIKHEIKKKCPSVIVDGSRPFRVHWTAINNDHCEVTVDTRHHIKPVGDAYLDNKQNVLTAIYTALKRNNCKLVELPVAFKVS